MSSSYKKMLDNDAQWCRMLGINNYEDINNIFLDGKALQLVNLCEARHENRCCSIANMILERPGVKVILLAGPSSSGKTSSSLRIALQCRIHGLNPRTIELDNYFLEREKTPLLPNGQYDFECLEAMDLELLNSQIADLVAGKTVDIPRFDFKDGKKYFEGNYMKLEENDIVILEGIHALDPAMLYEIPDDVKFKIYVSDVPYLSSVMPDMEVTDNRLLRRIARDRISRGVNAEQTIIKWPDVRAGEEKYIFPFQDCADVTFNSTLPYEVPVLIHFIKFPVARITSDSPAYPTAERLYKVLSNIYDFPVDAMLAIPSTSLMREFIGNQYLSRNLL